MIQGSWIEAPNSQPTGLPLAAMRNAITCSPVSTQAQYAGAPSGEESPVDVATMHATIEVTPSAERAICLVFGFVVASLIRSTYEEKQPYLMGNSPHGTRPCSVAYSVAAARVETPIFRYEFWMWRSAVLGEMSSLLAICLV